MAIRLTALFVAIIFVVFILGTFLRVFSWPSLDFLSESLILSRDPLVMELRQAVVQVKVRKRGTTQGEQTGSGFNIRPDGLIVTNRHLVEDASIITVHFPCKGAFRARSWLFAGETDLAVIFLEKEDLPVVTLGKKDFPQRGDELTVIGNPLGFPRIVVRGEVTGYRTVQSIPGKKVVEIDAPIHPGSSGSPAFTEEGEVAAVVFATVQSHDKGERRGLLIPLKQLRDFLQALELADP